MLLVFFQAQFVRCLGHVGRADTFVRFLRVLGLVLVDAWLGRDVVPAVPGGDGIARPGHGFGRHVDTVGPHVGDMSGFIQALRRRHAGLGAHAEFAAGFLLQGRGHEGRAGVAAGRLGLDCRDGQRAAFDGLHGEFGLRRVGQIEAVQFLAGQRDQARFEGLTTRGFQHGANRPVFAGVEGLDLHFAVDHEAQADGLHPASRFRSGQLAPQDRRQVEADQIIERTACQIGMDQRRVDFARAGDGLLHGFLGDGVEGHAADRHVLLDAPAVEQRLLQVPGNRLALAIGVGGQDQVRVVGQRVGDVLDAFLAVGRDFPGHVETVFGIDAAVLADQVADVAIAGQDSVTLAQISVDCLGFGRGFNDDDGHGRKPRTVRSGGICRRVFGPVPLGRGPCGGRRGIVNGGGFARIRSAGGASPIGQGTISGAMSGARIGAQGSEADKPAPGAAGDNAGQFHLREVRGEVARGDGAGLRQVAQQLIFRHGDRGQERQDAVAQDRVFGNGGNRLWRLRNAFWRRFRSRRKAGQNLQHVIGPAHQCRAIAQQDVTARGPSVERVARHREHIAALIQRIAGGDHGAGFGRRLDHDDQLRHARHDPVAPGKVAGLWRQAEGSFRKGAALFGDLCRQLDIFRRIDTIEPARMDCDRAARQRRIVGDGINAAGQTGGYDDARLRQVARQCPSHAQGQRGGVARADDGDGRAGQDGRITLRPENRGSRSYFGQTGRVSGRTERQQARAVFARSTDLAADRCLVGDRVVGVPRGARDIGQRPQCGLRGAVFDDQAAEGGWADTPGARQAQAREKFVLRRRGVE